MGCKAACFRKNSSVEFCFTLTMWDVKKSSSTSFAVNKARFTLTMWDVKVISNCPGSIVFRFYLNYVGCKVNNQIQLLDTPTRFYLNYVGCKAGFAGTGTHENSRFYLNYVGCKVLNSSFTAFCCSCFTLTMWDVKFFNSVINCSLIYPFYLNYVGCKGRRKNYGHLQRKKFYLNYVGCKDACIVCADVGSILVLP